MSPETRTSPLARRREGVGTPAPLIVTITPFPKFATGDAYLDARNASTEYAERSLNRIIPLPLPAGVGQLRPGRYRFLAVKYWRKNPTRLWWLGHVWDEMRADWRGPAA